MKATKRFISRIKKKGCKLSGQEVKELASLSDTEMQKVASELSAEQKQTIYKMLSVPPSTDWISKTASIHSRYKVSSEVPVKRERKDDFVEITRKVMVSAGDVVNNYRSTAEVLAKHVRSILQKYSDLSKSQLTQVHKPIISKIKKAKNFKLKLQEGLEFESEEETLEEISDIERLEFNELRTRNMSPEEYQEFSKCREANFLTKGKKKFCKWISAKHSAKVLSQVGCSEIRKVVETAIRNRSPEGSLTIQSDPLSIQDIKAVIG